MNLKKLHEKNNIFLFDLDRTIWKTHDKYGNLIWAKQMIEPYIKLDNNTIEDDVYNQTILQPGIEEYLRFLNFDHCRVGFISCGGLKNIKLDKQPSYKLLKEFNLLKYLSNIQILEYKDWNKVECHLKVYADNLVLFDDDYQVIEQAKQYRNITPVYRYSFKSWFDLIP